MRESLGRIYALLGDGEVAVREGRLAVELTARDRWSGPRLEMKLSEIYALLGSADDALDLVDKLLEMTYDDSLTVADLRFDPLWDPNRDDERFQALIAD